MGGGGRELCAPSGMYVVFIPGDGRMGPGAWNENNFSSFVVIYPKYEFQCWIQP